MNHQNHKKSKLHQALRLLRENKGNQNNRSRIWDVLTGEQNRQRIGRYLKENLGSSYNSYVDKGLKYGKFDHIFNSPFRKKVGRKASVDRSKEVNNHRKLSHREIESILYHRIGFDIEFLNSGIKNGEFDDLFDLNDLKIALEEQMFEKMSEGADEYDDGNLNYLAGMFHSEFINSLRARLTRVKSDLGELKELSEDDIADFVQQNQEPDGTPKSIMIVRIPKEPFHPLGYDPDYENKFYVICDPCVENGRIIENEPNNPSLIHSHYEGFIAGKDQRRYFPLDKNYILAIKTNIIPLMRVMSNMNSEYEMNVNRKNSKKILELDGKTVSFKELLPNGSELQYNGTFQCGKITNFLNFAGKGSEERLYVRPELINASCNNVPIQGEFPLNYHASVYYDFQILGE